MSKAILVIDMPKACEDCPLSLDTEKENTNLCRGCEKYSFNPDSRSRPDWCPLTEVFKKKASKLPPMADMPMRYTNYEKGWNACIDEILRGAKKI